MRKNITQVSQTGKVRNSILNVLVIFAVAFTFLSCSNELRDFRQGSGSSVDSENEQSVKINIGFHSDHKLRLLSSKFGYNFQVACENVDAFTVTKDNFYLPFNARSCLVKLIRE